MLSLALAFYFSSVPIPDKSKDALANNNNNNNNTSINNRQRSVVDDGEEVLVVDYQREEVLGLNDEEVSGAAAPTETKRSLLQEVRLLLSSVKVSLYLFTVFIMGMGSTLIGSFLFLFLQDLGGTPNISFSSGFSVLISSHPPGDQLLMGVTLACTVSTEIPFFFFSGRLIKSVGVHILILTAMVIDPSSTFNIRLAYACITGGLRRSFSRLCYAHISVVGASAGVPPRAHLWCHVGSRCAAHFQYCSPFAGSHRANRLRWPL